jgi:hypothetical protein
MHTGVYAKYPFIWSDFNETWIFSTYFQNIFKYQISWKSVNWEPICFPHADGQTDVTNLIVAFRNFLKAPKNKKKMSSMYMCCGILKWILHNDDFHWPTHLMLMQMNTIKVRVTRAFVPAEGTSVVSPETRDCTKWRLKWATFVQITMT